MLANLYTKSLADRWRSFVVGSAILAALLVFGMAVYRDIDLSIYTSLPEAFRSLFNIPADADIGSLAYGAIYSGYGELTLAGLAIAMGSGAIAGEERAGTIGLLLANPLSRTQMLAAKAESMVTLTAAGTLVLWAAARLAPALLDVSIVGMQIEALILHMFANALLYGFVALALSAWTGSRGRAAGITAGVMILSFVGAGLFPLIEGWENAAKAFPWYYFDGAQPLLNGVAWGHIGLLAVGAVAGAGAAVVGVNRRDLRDRTAGEGLVDRLRSHPVTNRIANRLAGSARVSRLWIKTASDHQAVTLITAILMFGVMGVLLGPMYNAIDDALRTFSANLPDALLAIFGAEDVSTPEGFYQIETFGLMAPIAVMVVTVTVGAKGLAGEEDQRTMGLLLANPISTRGVRNMSYETIKPAEGETPLTWPEKDLLWTEVVMGTSEADSEVPYTEESRRLRRRLRAQWRDMRRRDVTADHVKD